MVSKHGHYWKSSDISDGIVSVMKNEGCDEIKFIIKKIGVEEVKV